MKHSQTAAKERRVTLALKWRYLDGDSVDEIRQRFIDNGYGEYTYETVSRYLNEAPSEEVRKQIEEEHADVRLRVIDRHERKHDRALEAERSVTKREEVIALRPESARHAGDTPINVPDWVVLDESEHPSDATSHDKRIRFTDETRAVQPGEQYYVQDPDGEPIYEEYVAAVVEVPDDKQQSFLRREQSHHLEQQGEAAGVYEEDINVNMSGGVDHSVELDAETAAAIRQADLGGDADE